VKDGRAQRTLRFDCSPISNTCTDGKAGASRLRRDERFGVRSRWFLSDPGSSPARARIQQLRRLLSDNNLYIKVKRVVYLSGRSDLQTRRNNCAAQGVSGRRFFVKGSEAKRTHHLNFCEMNGFFWRSHLAFRDYLELHPGIAKEYSALKRKLADRFPNIHNQHELRGIVRIDECEYVRDVSFRIGVSGGRIAMIRGLDVYPRARSIE